LVQNTDVDQRNVKAAIFNLTRGICGEVRIVERAFGLGSCMLTETIALIGESSSSIPLDARATKATRDQPVKTGSLRQGPLDAVRL
jgi:hypothetical protein